jgi:predicted aconitase
VVVVRVVVGMIVAMFMLVIMRVADVVGADRLVHVVHP